MPYLSRNASMMLHMLTGITSGVYAYLTGTQILGIFLVAAGLHLPLVTEVGAVGGAVALAVVFLLPKIEKMLDENPSGLLLWAFGLELLLLVGAAFTGTIGIESMILTAAGVVLALYVTGAWYKAKHDVSVLPA